MTKAEIPMSPGLQSHFCSTFIMHLGICAEA